MGGGGVRCCVVTCQQICRSQPECYHQQQCPGQWASCNGHLSVTAQLVPSLLDPGHTAICSFENRECWTPTTFLPLISIKYFIVFVENVVIHKSIHFAPNNFYSTVLERLLECHQSDKLVTKGEDWEKRTSYHIIKLSRKESQEINYPSNKQPSTVYN